MLPEHPSVAWIESFLDGPLAGAAVAAVEPIVHALRSLDLPETLWIADALELGNLEIRLVGEELVSEFGQPASGAYICGSAAATGRGIVIAASGCTDLTVLAAHEGTHFHDEIFELTTGIRISTRCTELHAYAVTYKVRERILRGSKGPQSAAGELTRAARDWSRQIVTEDYYAASSSESMLERAEPFTRAFKRSRTFSTAQPPGRDAARRILRTL